MGRDGPSGRGWASVVLKERQEVIVTIARQVRGIQVREELIGICEFWKELEEKYRSPDEVSAEGLDGLECGRRGHVPSLAAARGPGPTPTVLAVPRGIQATVLV